MSAVIRPARAADAAAISAIAREAFGEDVALETARLARVLSQSGNFVAFSNNRVDGFVGNFLTRSSTGALRFELDLLAVARDARGRGVGAALVAESICEAEKTSAEVIRALVASRNRRMQSLCRAHGFERNRLRQALYVLPVESDKRGGTESPDAGGHGAHLIPVETFTYSGIWLEGRLDLAGIAEARRRAVCGHRSRIGAVVSQTAGNRQELLEANGFAKIGDFDWWTLSLRSGSS